ncbi:HNH endonuclease [Corynebacterium pygosceleis]|uniref:HNH endonuclease n=1 Tax=Corynebacterium pygosceleis TaxID=2800406 RepID=UPI003CFFDF6E
MAHRWHKRHRLETTAKQRRHILNRDGHTCQLHGPHCTTEATEVDHIKPVAEGGTNTATNLRAVCRPCHRQKSLEEAARGRKRANTRAKYQQEPHPGLKH